MQYYVLIFEMSNRGVGNHFFASHHFDRIFDHLKTMFLEKAFGQYANFCGKRINIFLSGILL